MTGRPFPDRATFAVTAFALLATACLGCGDSTSPAPARDAGTSPEITAESAAHPRENLPPENGTVGTTKAGQRGRNEIYVDDQGQKWYGNIPYDVFFDEPYTVASDNAPLTLNSATAVVDAAMNPPNLNPTASPSTDPAPSVSPPVSSSTNPTPSDDGNDGWAAVISAAALDEEVKNIRNFLNENLQSVGNYNSAMLMVPPKAAALGVLAGVAMEHPDKVSWKEDAIYIRDLAKQMNAAALQRGPKDQKRLLALYEAIADTLNRSRPAGLAEPPASDTYSDVSEMRLIMMRMEEAEKKMRTEAGSEGAFTANKAMVQHEASMLATMTRTVTLPGYGYEDDKEFVGYGQAIIEAAKSILTATESNDFAAYELSLSKIATTCQSCHSKYKND